MHPHMSRVLERRQLSAAGQLFAVNHYDVITDLNTAFSKLKSIFDTDTYAENSVDQSIVEIVIARITAAIRETGSIECYSAELVDVLDSCLKHEMTIFNEDCEPVDSPHCKIANDLLSSLFLHYGRRSVMTLTLPVAIKALGCDNPELVRNTTSYISLAAIHNGKSLAQYALQIISLVLKGNYSLLRVLPQIYSDNREPFNAHLKPLLDLLEKPEMDCSDKLSLLQLSSMIANYHPQMLTPFLSKFDRFLCSPPTCASVLNIYMSLVSRGRADVLAPCFSSLKVAARRPNCSGNITTISKIVGNIGRVSAVLAVEAVEELLKEAETVDSQVLSSILCEIEGVGETWPDSVRPFLERIQSFAEPSTQRIIQRITLLMSRAASSTDELGKMSVDSLSPHVRIPPEPSTIITSGSRTVFNVSDCPVGSVAYQLDRDTQSLALQYQNLSSGSLSHQRSHASFSNSLPGRDTQTTSGSRELSMVSTSRDLASSNGGSRLVSDGPSNSLARNPLNPTHIQIGKDGRVRPVTSGRQPVNWPSGSIETTFPANQGPVISTKKSVAEEENKWMGHVDRSDVVLQFVEHRRNKIKRYMDEVTARFPIPIQCTVEGSKNSKNRMLVHWSCASREQLCAFYGDTLFCLKTKYPHIWLHLMFLQMESSSIESNGYALSQQAPAFGTLANCWKCLANSYTKGQQFVTLVTSAFPGNKEQEKLLKELEEGSFFDAFQMDPSTNAWNCFSCANPDKVKSFTSNCLGEKVLKGQLKEKKGTWNFLRRWQTKYFSLSCAALTYSNQQALTESSTLAGIDLKTICSVKSLSRGRKSRKSLRKVFQICTKDNMSVVLKAGDERQAEEWMQCIQIAVAQARRETQTR